jgi:endonuclease/exonuclease/phosphatase family metal-dependent hydrolase
MRLPRLPLVPRRLLLLLAALSLAATGARAQWDPGAGEWGKVAPEDVRVMTWNVEDMLCRHNDKVEGQNDWCACARIVAALKPDVLVLQECGDNDGNGSSGGNDSVSQLLTTAGLFLEGGNDPFNGGPVTAYVQKYAPGYDLPYRFVSAQTDGYNRNVVLSRFPFQDLNGDGDATYSDIPTVSPDQYAPGGDGGLRGYMLAELELPDATYLGDLVVGNGHLKAGSGSSDHDQRTEAARNIAYLVDYWYNGAGSGVPDPNGRIADSPPATQILAPDTPVVLMGDWNEEEGASWSKGPAGWLTRAQQTGGTDGTDRDRTDSLFDDARHYFTGDPDTLGNVKFDYVGWQESIATERISCVFDTFGTPTGALPAELIGLPTPGNASNVASDHRPVLVDVVLPLACGGDPTNYCVGAPNSIGGGATIGSVGPTGISQNDFTLTVVSARPGQFGLFFYGPEETQVPFGDGFRCVAPGAQGIFRLYPPITADPFGDGERQLDFTQPPADSGPGQITPGSTWYFQYWYRDPGGPGGTGFNFSDGLAATFCG